jgi:mono/diheme cytochrome c family protein
MKTPYPQPVYSTTIRRASSRFAAACVAALLAAAIFSLPAIAQEKLPSSKNATTDSQPAEDPPAVARGRTIYRDRCAICHFSDSNAGKIGPGLKGIYKRGKFANGSKVDDASMEKLIVKGGKDMPPFQAVLNSAQIRDLLAYLRTL